MTIELTFDEALDIYLTLSVELEKFRSELSLTDPEESPMLYGYYRNKVEVIGQVADNLRSKLEV